MRMFLYERDLSSMPAMLGSEVLAGNNYRPLIAQLQLELDEAVNSKIETMKSYKHIQSDKEGKTYEVFEYPRMLSSMFLPRNIPENIDDDVILKQILSIKSGEVDNLMEKIYVAKKLPITEIKDYLTKLNK